MGPLASSLPSILRGNTAPHRAMIPLETRSSKELTGPPQKPSPKSPGPNLTLHDFTMGRTLHYHVFGSLEGGGIPMDTRQRIDLAHRMLNHHFSWTCDNLGLTLFDHPEVTPGTEPPVPWAPRIGWGFTKVAADEWNAALVTRFVRWLSTQLPTGTFIRLQDEGDYIIAKNIIVTDGKLTVDTVTNERQRRYLRSNGMAESVARLAEGETAANEGEWFARVSASSYHGRHEIRALGIPDTELTKMTLEDVADRVTFPWQTEWLKSPAD
jgi:hypothetical protein